ncbi:hypothetical protein F4808DRAFT_140932 [Astrocystis sublimbata]|nr:hypothetical protein F4808DRAFT_140932 [Astrocystis sublimbata]
MDSKRKSTAQSRILREMQNHAERPFWSPPASTGSHGTVTLTSDLSIPDGESTPGHIGPVINTSALARHFPEWKDYHLYKENQKRGSVPAPSRSPSPSLPPSPSPAPPAVNHDDSEIFMENSPRLRAHVVQMPVVDDTMELNAPPKSGPPRGNLTTLLNTLQTARIDKPQPDEQSVKPSSEISPTSQLYSRMSANAARRVSRQARTNEHSAHESSLINQTAHSFFLPSVNHLHDLVSGTLRWSTLRNGMPIFVKHGKVHDKDTKKYPDHHADFEAVSVPDDEEQIFVSLDKIRDEIHTLQEHDEVVSKQAEQLHNEVCELQNHVATLQSRKDSAVGTEYDSSLIVQLTTNKAELEGQVSSLKTRLDQANRQISLNDLHGQAFATERDEALQRVSDHVATIKRLQSRNDSITRQKLEFQEALKAADEDLDCERAVLESLQQKYKLVDEEKGLLKHDITRLERQNEDLFHHNDVLQQKNTLLERESIKHQNKAAQLQELVDELHKKLSLKPKPEAPKQTQEPTRTSSGRRHSKLTKLTQNWESGDRFTVLSEASARSNRSQTRASKHDDTHESDFTQGSRQQYTLESNPDKHTIASELSAKSTSHTDLNMQDDYTQQINLTRDTQLDADHDNMTSALFIDDVTLDAARKATRKQKSKMTPAVQILSPVPSATDSSSLTQQATSAKQKNPAAAPVLTQSAKRVLDTLCHDHECYNCMVCARIQSHRHEANGKCAKKKTVRVERPVPVSDRVTKASPSTSTYDCEDPTLRPSQDPALALAKVMKGLKDEERHIRTSMARKQAVYDECDPALNKKLWKKVDGEIRALRQRRDLKRDQIYDLHDVLEGQKSNAQVMSEEAIDVTIMSVLSKDPTWNGIMDF